MINNNIILKREKVQKMNTFGEKLKKLRLKNELSQEELAQRLNKKYGYKLNKGMISKWENNKVEPRLEALKGIAVFFGETLDYLIGIKKEETSNVITFTHSYKYLPTSISAGKAIDIESIDTEDIQIIEIPDKLMGKYAGSRDVFITKISGDSMDKVIPDGSFIAVKKVKDVKELRDNDIVLFSNQHEYSVKRYFKINNKVVFKPDSTNPDHFDQVMTTDDDFASLIIYGKVVWYVINI